MSRGHSYSRSRVHSPTFLSLHLRHSSFSNPSLALPTSQLILQPFLCFTYVTAHSPTLTLLHLRHSSFSNPSVASPTHSSFSNPSVTSPMSQLILQPFRCFTYVTAHSQTLLPLLLRHRIFTYVTWRAAHELDLNEIREEIRSEHKLCGFGILACFIIMCWFLCEVRSILRIEFNSDPLDLNGEPRCGIFNT